MNFTGSPPGTGETANPEAIRRLNAFEKRVTPAVADSYNNLGAIAAEGKDYADALTNFQRAAEWNPSFDGLDYNWGRAAFSASRFGDAIMPLSRYLRSHQDDSGIRAALGISQFMTHDYDGCIRTLQPAEGDLNSIPQVQYVYADSLVKTGQFSSGMERLDSLEKSHPEIAEVHRALGEAFERQGQKQKAIEELKAAIGLNRNDPETHYVLGEVELESGDAGSAIPELESAIHLKSDDPKFHQALAIAYKLTLRTADAAREVQIYDALRAAQSKRSEIPSGSAAAWH
jgi:predicted Zn-dependent protease